MWQTKTTLLYLFLFLGIAAYVFLGYFTTQDNFLLNFGCYALAFVSYLGLFALRNTISFNTLLFSTVVLHGVFLFSIPALSPDVYRFLWDGELFTLGIHPYAFTPEELVASGQLEMTPYLNELYVNITDLSKANYSVYPTVNQLYFVIPAFLADNVILGIVIMRLLMLGSLFAGVYFLRKIFIELKIPESRLFLFVLNPLVVVEASGNLHFEAVMFSFLACSFYFIVKQKWLIGALLFACAVNIKLTPLLLLPFFLHYLGWKQSLKFYVTVLVLSGVLLMVFLWPSVVPNFMQSIDLYFNSFEFNSSIYRLSTYLFQPILTHDTAIILGPLLSKIALLIIIFLALFFNRKSQKSMFVFMLTGYVVYLLFATTVHPWYLIIPLGLALFTKSTFMIYWSFIVFISYTFYAIGQNGWVNMLIGLEYIGLIIWIVTAPKVKLNPLNDKSLN